MKASWEAYLMSKEIILISLLYCFLETMIFFCSSSLDLSDMVHYANVIMSWLTITEHPCNRWLRISSVSHRNNPVLFVSFISSKCQTLVHNTTRIKVTTKYTNTFLSREHISFLRSKTQAVGDLDQMHDILQSQHFICLQMSQVTQSIKKKHRFI
jgi:hypothetical protein